MKTYEAENLCITTAPDGAISDVAIKGKQFSGFPGEIRASEGINVSAVWTNCGTHLACTLELLRVSGAPEDGASVRFRIPYQEMQYNLKVWTARKGFPQDIWDIGGRTIYYGDICFGTLLPAAAIYDPVTDTGITVAKQPGRTGGRFAFRFDDYHGAGMYVEVTCLKVTGDKPAKVTLLFCGHDGCWRPGLRWYRDLFPEYFEPVVKDVYNCSSFAISNPFTDPAYLQKYRPAWAEIHNHFPHYGDYLPDEEEWTSVIAHDYPQIAAERDLTVSKTLMHKHIADLHAANIRAMYYFQCSGDGLIPWAEKNFPDDIARDCGGHTIPTWQDCIMVNSAKGSSFGKFVNDRIHRLLDVYPEIDGVFADQVCYQTIDWAHDDGRTAADGKCGYEYGLSIEENLKDLAEIMHAKGKPILGNGPFDMECGLYVDAIMCEGTGGNYDTLKYLCLRKPLLNHSYPFTPIIAEKVMRGCVLSASGWSMGGSSTLINPEWKPEVEQVYKAYLPLVNALFGSELLLTTDPLQITPADLVKAEIFKSRDREEYLIGAVWDRDSLVPEVEFSVKLPVENVKAEILKLGNTEWQPLEIVRKDDRMIITFTEHFHACVIRFIAD